MSSFFKRSPLQLRRHKQQSNSMCLVDSPSHDKHNTIPGPTMKRANSDVSVLTRLKNSPLMRRKQKVSSPNMARNEKIGTEELDNISHQEKPDEITSNESKLSPWLRRWSGEKLARRLSDSSLSDSRGSTNVNNNTLLLREDDDVISKFRPRAGSSESNVLRVINTFNDVLKRSPLSLRRNVEKSREAKRAEFGESLQSNERCSSVDSISHQSGMPTIQQIDVTSYDLSNVTSFRNKGFLPNQLLVDDDLSSNENFNYYDFEELRNKTPMMSELTIRTGNGCISRL